MGFTFNGLSGAAVTLSGTVNTSLNEPDTTQTVVNQQYSTTGAGVETAYTVPASHTLYLTAVSFYKAATAFVLYANDGATVLWNMNTDAGVSTGFIFAPASPIAVFTAGQAVKVSSSAGAGTVVNLIGFLVDA